MAEADKEIEAFMLEGKHEADAIMKAAEEKARREKESYRKKAEEEARKARAKEISGAEMEAKKAILQEKQDILEEIIAEAKKQMCIRDRYDTVYAEKYRYLLRGKSSDAGSLHEWNEKFPE